MPLQQARNKEFYPGVLSLMRGMLSDVIKNDKDCRCILTGCLRAVKESIFTGANSIMVYGMDEAGFSQLMGFTEDEVSAMLSYYELDLLLTEVRAWYDGYIFYKSRIYCPWSIACFCAQARESRDRRTRNFWINTSSNDFILEVIDRASPGGIVQLQTLLDGGSVKTHISENVSFFDLKECADDRTLFNIIWLTGYLTRVNAPEEQFDELKIPNREVRECFEHMVRLYFNSSGFMAGKYAAKLLAALKSGEAMQTEAVLNYLFGRFLSIRSMNRELACHVYTQGFLSAAGTLLRLAIEEENGLGFSDVSFCFDASTGCILEFKLAKDAKSLQAAALQGLEQIESRRYAEGYMRKNNLTRLYCYGIGCREKACAVAARIYSLLQ